jgi:hypothetical protein
MLLGTPNQGMIFLASVLDTPAAFSLWVGYAFTQPMKVQTTHHQKVPINFICLNLSEVDFQVLEWVDSPLLDK